MKHILISFCLFACFATFLVSANEDLPKPSALQMKWQKMETIGFIHFSINTYTDMEWGVGNESPSLFNPDRLDCRQWVRTCKEAGIKGIILTAKHHDGFCLWPSKYTEHSVKNSPWRDGKGDLVKELSDACREYDVKMGLYLSPWDCNHPEYGKPAYVAYFRNQLRELLTNYGDIFEIWFDGANGGRGYYGTDSLHTRKIPDGYYEWEKSVQIVRELQPGCIVHGGDIADVRWVGNEEGYAGTTHWSMMSPPEKPSDEISYTIQLNTGFPDGRIWKPSETDVSVRPGWYYHASEDHQLKSLPELLTIYYESVGRNSLLLLNIPPNKHGLIHPADSARLIAWKKQLDLELDNDLLPGNCRFSPSQPEGFSRCLDGNEDSFWELKSKKGFVEINFGREVYFNRILLGEYIPEGQRVSSFTVSYLSGGEWKELDRQTTIGYKRILRYPETKTSGIRIDFNDALANPLINRLSVYNAPVIVEPPLIRRDRNGWVTIVSPDSYSNIYYTLNGKEPSSTEKNLYKGSFMADGRQTIKAMTEGGHGRISEVAEKTYLYSRKGWKVVGDTLATDIFFDEQSDRTWRAEDRSTPVVIDLGEDVTIEKIYYTPDQFRNAHGIILKYAVSVSSDGQQWSAPVQGEFANIRNNPVTRPIQMPAGSAGRYLKIQSVETVHGDAPGIAEIDIVFSRSFLPFIP